MSRITSAFLVLSLAFAATVSYAEQQSSLSILDEQQHPVAGAIVLVGSEDGVPFPGNKVITGADGVANVPVDWKAELPVTVLANGFITTTLPVTQPGDRTIVINKQESATETEVKGTPSDFGRLISDGKVDFSLILPNFNRRQLLAFSMATVLSPQVDVIEILGNRVPLPSNITLPQQTESFIFPVELNKPDYRTYFRYAGNYVLSALHGQFPMQRVINEIRAGKSIFDVLNNFTFLERGQTTVDVQGNLASVNFPVNQTRLASTITMVAPTMPNTQIVYGVALDEQNGLLAPTDVKRFTSGQSINLKTHAGSVPNVLGVLAPNANPNGIVNISMAPGLELEAQNGRPNQEFSQASLALVTAVGGAQPLFLPLINKPAVAGQVISAQIPALPAGLTAAGMYLVYSEVEKLDSGSVKNERITRLWEVWSDQWTTDIQLPKIDFAKNPNRVYRWEVVYQARTADAPAGNVSDLKTITHVTRNALDL